MSEENKAIELRILENNFTVKAGESEEYIREIAAFVNDELTKVKDRNPFTNHIRIAILGCMNITEMLFDAKKDVLIAERKQESEANNVNLVREDLTKAQAEIAELKKNKLALVEEKEALQKEIDEKDELLNQYREHLKQAKAESENSRKAILDLQNQLFESQIELVKATKKNPEDLDVTNTVPDSPDHVDVKQTIENITQ